MNSLCPLRHCGQFINRKDAKDAKKTQRKQQPHFPLILFLTKQPQQQPMPPTISESNPLSMGDLVKIVKSLVHSSARHRSPTTCGVQLP